MKDFFFTNMSQIRYHLISLDGPAPFYLLS